jgi:hypothetical protein
MHASACEESVWLLYGVYCVTQMTVTVTVD